MEWLFIGMSALGLVFTRYTQKEVERPYKVRRFDRSIARQPRTNSPHSSNPQVPFVIPIIVVVASAYLVVAPLVLEPDPFVLYASCFTASGLLFYFPLVYFKLKIPGVDHVTAFLQQLFNVAPDKKNS